MSILATFFKIDDQLNDKKCNDIVIDGVDVIKDVIFDESNPDLLKADLFIPNAVTQNRKILINIHGGGWVSGDKKWRTGFSMLMCDNKHFVMNINYGLSPQYKYPQCISHVFAALRWIDDNAEKYALDTSNVFLSGDSAGAQIAAFIGAIINNQEELAKLNIVRPKCSIHGLLLFCGAFNMQKLLKLPISSKICYEITGKRQRELKSFEFYSELNTYYFIDDTFPKTIIVSALLDAFVHGQGDILEMFLINRRIKHKHFISTAFTTADHCFHLRYKQKDSRASIDLAKQFMNGEILEG